MTTTTFDSTTRNADLIDYITANTPADELPTGLTKMKKADLLEVVEAIQAAEAKAAKAKDKARRKNEKNRGEAWATDEEGLSAKEVAAELNTDPRTIRKFFRTSDLVGRSDRGNRYSIRPSLLGKLRTAFAEWLADQEADEAADAEGDEG